MQLLTDSGLQNAEFPAKGFRLLFDTHRDAPRGFGARLTANGVISFIFRYNINGRDRLVTIGRYKEPWTLKTARNRAHELRHKVDTGTDIAREKRKQSREPTLNQALERYFDERLSRLKSGKTMQSTMRRYLSPQLGKVKIKDIRRAEIIEIVREVESRTPRQAGLLLTYTKGFFAWAEDQELIDANRVYTIKPGNISKLLTSRKRQRVLTDGEIWRLWNLAEGSGLHKMTCLCLKFALITGQRPGEVAGMTWDEIEGDVWACPATRRGKTETGQRIPLTPLALALLEEAESEAERLSKRRKIAASYVFEAKPGSAVTTVSLAQAVRRRVKELGNDGKHADGHWKPNDLRRTCRTKLGALGVPELIAELTVGHTRRGIAAVYDLHRYEREIREALTQWQNHLLELVKADGGPQS